VLDDMSPPKSPSNATTVNVVGLPPVTIAKDEVSRLQVQLEAVQEAMTRSEWEAACAMASHAEA
jgi:hypothetical protein